MSLSPATSVLPSISCIALGTVQFGLPYGVSNKQGQVSLEEAKSILKYAWDHGITTLDTAILYGDSESRLGNIGVDGWHVVTKLPRVPENCPDVKKWVRSSVQGSLQRLRIDHLHGLLLHRPDQLLSDLGERLFQALMEMKDDDWVRKIGISIYDPQDLYSLCGSYHFDVIQVPLNVLDRRMLNSGWLVRLRNSGTEVHIRSVFLQGLLLMSPEDRPHIFNRWQSTWNGWDAWVRERRLTPLKACLGYVLSYPEIHRVVVGVESMKQLKEIIMAVDGMALRAPNWLGCDDVDLINPTRWNNL